MCFIRMLGLFLIELRMDGEGGRSGHGMEIIGLSFYPNFQFHYNDIYYACLVLIVFLKEKCNIFLFHPPLEVYILG